MYGVEPQYVTPGRPTYTARGGYLGSQVKLGMLKRVSARVKFFAAMNIGYYDRAKNEESPLHQDNINFGIGCGFMYSFWQSEDTAAGSRVEGDQGSYSLP